MMHNYFNSSVNPPKQISKLANRLRIGLFAFVLTALGITADAQISSYVFSQSSGTYTPISGGTVLGVVANDDTSFPDNPIGFSFCYNGITYTRFSVQSNGFICMGSTITSTYTSIASNSNPNCISAFNYDIQGNAATGDLQYAVLGSSPNRTLVVQWSHYRSYNTTNGDDFNFQIRLSENNGNVDIVYGSNTDANLRTPAVGLQGASNADFNVRSVSNGLQTWATSITGGTSGATCEINPSLVPASGQTYTWAAPIATAPTTFTFSAVTASSMTLNWVDASTIENGFLIQYSLDNITFTNLTTVVSTSSATTGTPYTYNATGLFNNQLYYWRISATSANCFNPFVANQQATNPGTLCGTYTIGPTGAYTSLTAAVAAVQANGVLCPLIFEFQAAYVSTVETFPIVIPFLGNGPSATITARPELGATNLSITSATSQTIDFSGATYFSFDGRPGGVGVLSQLTIANTSTTGNAVRFINDARNCGLDHMKIRGVTTSTSNGVIAFSNASASTLIGNNNNFITNSDITSGATSAAILIYGNNSIVNTMNSGNRITDNVFYNWFIATGADAAINVNGLCTGWNINNNSFYQTATRTYTSAITHYAVFINTGTNTGNFTLNTNFIGGSAANCGGTAWTDAGGVAHRFIGINVTTNTVGTNSLQGNTIQNFNFTTTSSTTTTNGIWCAISLTGTSASSNVGNVTPNIIGSGTAAGSIVTSSSISGGMVVGINSTATGTLNISNNIIGGITANTSSVAVSSSITGIIISSGIVTISGNTIGSLTQTNSLINAASTSATGGHVTGISSSAFTTTTISNNTVMNLTNQYAGTSTTGQVRGIVTTSAINTITGNTIRNLAILSPQTGTTTSASVLGISQQSTTTGIQTVSNNTISNLANGSSTGNVQVNGILVNSSTSNSVVVNKNNIQAIGAPLTSGTPLTAGVQIYGGIARVYNNFIVLGLDNAGNPLTAAQEYDGIYKNTANRATIDYNSVSVTGSGVANGAANTFAYRRLLNPAASPADSLYNNILSNTRSNAAAGGTHYSLGVNNTTQLVANNNDYFGNGTGYQMGLNGVTQYLVLNNWISATGLDLSSFNVNPNFLSATNLHINNATSTALESRGTVISGIAVDIDNDQRPGPVGSVNGGGTIPDIGADEFDGIPLAIDMGVFALNRPSITGCHGASDSVVVTVKNYSTQTISFASNPISVTVNITGINPATFGPITVNTGTLAPNGLLNITVSTTYNMSAVGAYTFNASATTVGDVVSGNDAMGTVTINVSGGTVLSSVSQACLGTNATMTVSGYTNGGTIQWQSSPDNLTWTNVVGATNPTLVVAPSDTTFYRAVICGLHPSTSDTLNVIIVSPPTTVGATRCGTGPVSLSASGPGTLNWYDASSGGNLVNSGTTFNPTVSTTTTYYVEGSSGTSNGLHTTTFAAGNGSSGNMFGITAINTITITGFDGHVAGPETNDWSIYYRPDDYLLVPGANTSSAGWILLGSATAVPAMGTGVPTPIPVTFAVTIPAGQTYSFHVVSTLGGTVSYTNGTAAGNVYNSNADLQFREGHGGTLFSCTNVPRVFNGRIHYSAGCASMRTPVTATVTTAPTILASVGSVNYCNGDSATLSVSSGNGGYSYTWSPSAYLNSTTTSTVMSGPPSPGTFTYFVDALDASTGCATRDTVSFIVNPIPTVGASVDVTPICSGTSVNLTASQPSATVQVTNGNVLNTSTSYPAPYGQFYGGSRHQMLILASELTAAGMTAGNLNGLTFQVTNTNASAALVNFTISLGLTTAPDLAAGFLSVSMATVYTNPSYAPVVGVNTHTFSAPFFWDGVSNIVVETCFANYTVFPNTTFTTNCTMRQTTTSYVSCAYNRYDNTANICGIASTFTALQRPNIAFIRDFSTWTYGWTPIASVSNPTALVTTATPPTTTMFVITVTDTTSGCASSDSVNVVVNPNPAPNLGPDTAICSNTSITLDGSAGPYNYMWNTAATTQTISVNSFGNYDVLVTDSVTGCSARDTVLIGINSAPAFTLGSDVTICAGNSVTFSGPSGQFDYSWNTSDTTQTITIGINGSYVLMVTDTVNACFNSDTVALTVNALPVVNLGSDVAICTNNAPVILTAPSGNYSYLWNDASTNDSLTVNSSGSYFVTVTDNTTTCYNADTIAVTVNPNPVVALGNDTTFCSGMGPITLMAPSGSYNYLWNDASTGSTLTTNTTGSYSVTVTDASTGCSATDLIDITVNPTPVVNLGSDTSMCGGSVTLDAQNAGANYMWSDSTVAQTLVVTSTGNYYVDVTTGAGCASSDSIMITINTPPTVTFTTQSTACTTDPAFALTGSPAGGLFTGPGVAGNMFSPSSAGVGAQTIAYNYTDANGCSGTATSTINVSACVGVTEPFVAAGMNVFPNPNNGSFTLTIQNADYTEISIQLMSVDGKIISSDMASNVKGDFVKQLDLTQQANGIYFLRIVADGQTFMQKIVKED